MSAPTRPGGDPPAAPPVPSSMPAVVMDRYDGTDALLLSEAPVPAPGPDQVLIRVTASSANPIDWHYLTGTPYLVRVANGVTRPRRRILGVDVAGAVVARGAAVTEVGLGDVVMALSAGGAFAGYVAVDVDHVIPLPAGVDLNIAAATPLAGLTALQGLRTQARVRDGDRVLINGAAGGVGTFALQIATILGASSVTAVCSAANAEQARALGATQVIDYRTTNFTSPGARYDVVLDMVGNHPATDLLQVLAPGGRYVAVSGPKDNRWLGPVPHLIRTRLGLARSGRTFHQFTAVPRTEDLRFLARQLASGQLSPTINRHVGLDGVAAALDEIATGHTQGKIVVRPDLTSVRSTARRMTR